MVTASLFRRYSDIHDIAPILMGSFFVVINGKFCGWPAFLKSGEAETLAKNGFSLI